MEVAEFLDQCPRRSYSGLIFRAIFTSFPARNLYSDIGFREGDPDYEIAMALADTDASIDFSKPQQLRPFQYGDLENFLRNYISEVVPRQDLLYPLLNAQKGQFSNGTFGVFYAALEEQTALAEVAYHFVEECRYDMKMSPDIFKDRYVDKRIVQLEVDQEKIPDFRPLKSKVPELTSEALDFCQKLGLLVKEKGIPMVFTPSARYSEGTCSPVFLESAIANSQAKTIRYYHFKFDQADGLKIKRSDVNQTDWPIPANWNLSPRTISADLNR